MREFEGRVAIVTGAGRGMGRAIAAAFVDSGAKVMIAARTVVHAEKTLVDLRSRGGDVSMCHVDVTSREDIERVVRDTVSTFGGVDTVVHSAAHVPGARLLDITDVEVEKTLATAIKASVWLIQAATPHLRLSQGGGRIVLISSICGPRTAIAGLTVYGAAKAAINALISGAALELAPDNITVNGVEPGVTSTDGMRSRVSPERSKAIAATIPLGRIAAPEEIAHAVLFLAAPKSAYITGRTITIDGGLSLSATDLASAPRPPGELQHKGAV